jgi:hypothetical protein
VDVISKNVAHWALPVAREYYVLPISGVHFIVFLEIPRMGLRGKSSLNRTKNQLGIAEERL